MPEMPTFKAFGADHLVMLAALAGACGTIVWIGKRLTAAQRVWTGRVLGVFLLGYVVAAYTQSGTLHRLSWRESLPLNLCDWILAACVLALFRPNALSFEIAYFWGFTGTFQALITPDLRDGFPSRDFFQFFWGHGGIFIAIIFLMSAHAFRPRPGSVPRMFLAINLYVLVAGGFNFLFGWNYGYLNHPPSHPSLIDHLGRWPWYILSMEGIALTSFCVLDFPWRRGRKRSQQSS